MKILTLFLIQSIFHEIAKAGVPRLRNHLRMMHPTAWQKFPKEFDVDHLCFDMNEILHASSKSLDYGITASYICR
jgi:hypothetical protein